jgi:GSH-dependent disulfide-bond oxidoreductase
MLELYHWEPTLGSGEPLICLQEKALSFTSHYVDLLELEQHEAEFLRLSPSGEVPVLVHDGRVLSQASLILEYLEDAFPATPLMPGAPSAQYTARHWVKYAEDRLTPAVALLGWRQLGRPQFGAARCARALESIERLPPERRRWWAWALQSHGAEEELALAREALTLGMGKLEQALAGDQWLCGAEYSLADIALFLVVRAVRAAAPELVPAKGLRHVLAWHDRVAERPAVRTALAAARVPCPEQHFLPGPELARWG